MVGSILLASDYLQKSNGAPDRRSIIFELLTSILIISPYISKVFYGLI